MGQAGMDSSFYSQLDVSRNEIRILTLDSALDADGKVAGLLSIVSLSDERELGYEAVSWSWGDVRDQGEIVLNGGLLRLPANAVEVLEMCVARQHGRVWLDAVCINQADLDERAQQVSIMDKVYSQAQQVLVWLGKDTSDLAKNALASFDLLLSQFKEFTDEHLGSDLEPGTNLTNDERFQIFFAETSPAPVFSAEALPDCDWRAIEDFFSAPWFFRLWVCQEAMLNVKVSCVRGSLERSWFDVGLAAKWLTYRRYWREDYLGKKLKGIGFATEMWHHTYALDPDWENLLCLGQQRHASEPADYVFALLGLIPKKSASAMARTKVGLQPDYRKDIASVFAAATRVAIKCRAPYTNALNVLWHAQVMVPRDSLTAEPWPARADAIDDWPSWVPRYDWVLDVERGSPPSPTDWHDDNAGGIYEQIQMADSQAFPLVLGLRGVRVSTVVATGRVFSKPFIEDKEALSKEILLWRQQAKQLGMSEDDFAMTLTSRLNHSEDDAAEDGGFQGRYASFVSECMPENALKRWSADSQKFIDALWCGSANKVCFSLENGQIGVGHPLTRSGDHLCILFCGISPFVLRPVDGQHKFVGHAYVHSIMHGEFIEQWKQDPSHTDSIVNFEIR